MVRHELNQWAARVEGWQETSVGTGCHRWTKDYSIRYDDNLPDLCNSITLSLNFAIQHLFHWEVKHEVLDHMPTLTATVWTGDRAYSATGGTEDFAYLLMLAHYKAMEDK